jgi:hypothetical protein
MKEGLLVHLVEKTPFTIPRRNGLQELLTLYLRTDETHLDDN